MDLKLLSIFPATKEQIYESRKRTFPEWGRGLTLDQYVEREEMLDTKPHATDGKMVVWQVDYYILDRFYLIEPHRVLAPRSDPTTIEFLCACEVYERQAVTSTGGPCIAYGIASVFTPSQYREKGYAKHLMRLLHFVLMSPGLLPSFPTDTWGDAPKASWLGKGVASALYSDVGDHFYTRCGPGIGKEVEKQAWITHDAIGTIWSVAGEDENPQGIQWLTHQELESVWEEDANIMTKEIYSDHREASATKFAFLPHEGVAQFFYERNRNFVPPEWKSDRWGARVADGQKLAYASWMIDPDRTGPSTLIITRLRADPKSFPSLLAAAKKVARELGQAQVEVWNLPSALKDIGSELGGVTRGREDHLPSIAWFEKGDVEWCHNEKYAWC